MKEGLDLLYLLQLKDDQIKEIEEAIGEVPLAIKKLEDERDGKASIIENSKSKLKENAKGRDKLEKDIQVIREKIKKYKEQMSKATTNKEYQGFTAEIKYEQDNIAAIEEKIIEKMLESDEIMQEIRKSEHEFNEIASEYNQKITDLHKNLEYHKEKLTEVSQSMKELRKSIPDSLVHTYDIVTKKKAGKAVSLIELDFCGACNIKIRPQRLNEVISSSHLFLCENCGRILFKKISATEETDPKNQ